VVSTCAAGLPASRPAPRSGVGLRHENFSQAGRLRAAVSACVTRTSRKPAGSAQLCRLASRELLASWPAPRSCVGLRHANFSQAGRLRAAVSACVTRMRGWRTTRVLIV